jgi:hypothetical protein
MNNPEEQATLSTRHRTNTNKTKNTTENYNNEPHRSHSMDV